MCSDTLSVGLPDLRDKFKFKLGTTSYIYPVETDNLLRNVTALAGFVDKVQLLCFGREYLDEFVAPANIARLEKLRADGLHFALHLPLDLGISSTSAAIRADAVALVERILQSTKPLDIDDFILHLDPHRDFEHLPFAIDTAFLDATAAGLDLLQTRTGLSGSRLCVENTNWDLRLAAELIHARDLSVCFDMGHLFLQTKGNIQQFQLEFAAFTRCFGPQIRELHVHGSDGTKDHRALSIFPPAVLATIGDWLASWEHSLIIEVFDETALAESIACLTKLSTKWSST